MLVAGYVYLFISRIHLFSFSLYDTKRYEMQIIDIE